MTIRNLNYLFQPSSVALVGASTRTKSVGAVVARNLVDGGFHGRVMMVNPHHDAVAGIPCSPDPGSLPEPPDLAIIATPASAVPAIISELATKGTKAAVVLSSGFVEDVSGGGAQLQQSMLDSARPHLLRIVGPNCLGLLNPRLGLNASFAHMMPPAGDLAFVAQSGAVIASVIDWAAPRNIGFSHLVALGDMADVDFGDMLDYLAQDQDTRGILLYVEMITHARKFMSAARAAARIKPIIVVKAGRHSEGARAAASHTGALAGADIVYDAAFRRAGMLRVYDLGELFSAVQTLWSGKRVAGDRLAVLTNGGGMGVMATDRLIDLGGRLASLSPATVSRLDELLPPRWSHGNPVDINGDADPARYAASLETLLADAETDAILVLNCPTGVASSFDAAKSVAAMATESRLSVLTSWIGSASASEGRKVFNSARVPTYETPEAAVQAFMHMVRYNQSQRALMETPLSNLNECFPDRAHVRAIINSALADGREWLSLPDGLAVLSAYGVPTVDTRFCEDIASLEDLAAAMRYPVVLKIVSPDILHKSDVHGVALNLQSPREVIDAAKNMHETLRKIRPTARLRGFVLQAFVQRRHAYELLVGIGDDRQFGRVALFGHGGTAAEIIADRAVELPPLNSRLAGDLIKRTRISKLLEGYRDRPAAAIHDIVTALTNLSELAADHPSIIELDINPLLADDAGVMALDCRVRVGKSRTPHLAIRPYPRELETQSVTKSGMSVAIRPIRPENTESLKAMFARSTAPDLYLRFFQQLIEVPDTLAARLTQIDYAREMAFVAFARERGKEEPGTAGTNDAMLGVVHLLANPDLDSAEFAIIVRSDMKGRGLGYILMRRMIDYGRSIGLNFIFGYVLRENTTMLAVAQELGFKTGDADEPNVCRVTLSLE